ncbi:hypothetical protein Q5752_000670 [Cryptotrichosporon argae]
MRDAAEPWYDREPADGALAPYDLVGMKAQRQSDDVHEALSACFFPFVGPLDPQRHWEGWADCFVYCEYELTVAMCTDDGLEVRWTYAVEDDALFTACWTVHPVTHHPLIIAAGDSGVLYVVDAVDRTLLRALKGHGAAVYAVRAHAAHAHVVASASHDNTVRLWNLLGSDSPAWGSGGNENYAMGKADEGGCAVAIVGGARPGGHVDGVIALDFHPTRQLLATGGGDRRLKLWPLPPLPAPELDTTVPRPPPRISFPLFTTKRIHRSAVASIQWLTDNVLASRDIEELALWRWAGMDRYLGADGVIAPTDYVKWDEMTESRSFDILARYATPESGHYWRMTAVHYPFRPSEQDTQDPARVNAPLIIVPVVEAGGRDLVVHIYNPALAKSLPPPPFPRHFDGHDEGDSGVSTEDAALDGRHGPPRIVSANKPWRLVASDWKRVVAAANDALQPIGTPLAPSVIRAVAVSPRGARWIVAVGDGGCVLLWKRRGREESSTKTSIKARGPRNDK